MTRIEVLKFTKRADDAGRIARAYVALFDLKEALRRDLEQGNKENAMLSRQNYELAQKLRLHEESK